ncbi:MAG: triose-phosphate isomerase, partial [Spirochaetota bacterium]
ENLDNVDVVVCPPYPFIEAIVAMTRSRNMEVGAQNLFYEERGAYTGEVSAPMLSDLGVKYVIVGHSERRTYFGETDSMINRKIKASLAYGLVPIFCVGETLHQRKEGSTLRVLNQQIVYGLEGIDDGAVQNIVMAYEPVWAIGTGMSATGEQAAEAHRYIGEVVSKFAGKESIGTLRVLYGGSVTRKNARDLLERKEIDGALVGGASLDAEHFCDILHEAASIEKH